MPRSQSRRATTCPNAKSHVPGPKLLDRGCQGCGLTSSIQMLNISFGDLNPAISLIKTVQWKRHPAHKASENKLGFFTETRMVPKGAQDRVSLNQMRSWRGLSVICFGFDQSRLQEVTRRDTGFASPWCIPKLHNHNVMAFAVPVCHFRVTLSLPIPQFDRLVWRSRRQVTIRTIFAELEWACEARTRRKRW